MIRELAARLQVREVAFDPWRAGQLAAELEREGVLTTVFPQSDSRMIPASARLHAAVVEGRLQLPDVAELHQHAANTIARHGRRAGDWTSRTSGRRTTRSSPCAWRSRADRSRLLLPGVHAAAS